MHALPLSVILWLPLYDIPAASSKQLGPGTEWSHYFVLIYNNSHGLLQDLR